MTNAQIEWVAKTKDRKFGRIAAPWNEQVEIFRKSNATMVNPEDVVEARLASYDGFSRTKLIS